MEGLPAMASGNGSVVALPAGLGVDDFLLLTLSTIYQSLYASMAGLSVMSRLNQSSLLGDLASAVNVSYGGVDDFFDSPAVVLDHARVGNLNLTIAEIRALLQNPSRYPSSIREDLTRRNSLIIAFYFTIVVVSLFGNLLVCYVILKRKRMRISTNLLMANLALSDLLMTVINIPFNIARILLTDWPFGSTLCILVPLVQVTSV